MHLFDYTPQYLKRFAIHMKTILSSYDRYLCFQRFSLPQEGRPSFPGCPMALIYCGQVGIISLKHNPYQKHRTRCREQFKRIPSTDYIMIDFTKRIGLKFLNVEKVHLRRKKHGIKDPIGAHSP